MITEQRVMAILADSNPVPDVEELDLVQLGTASYLADLEQRSSEVTQLDKKTQTTEKDGNRRLIAVLAASVVVILGVVLVILQSDSDPVADDTVVTTVPEDGSAEESARVVARTALLTSYADASNSGDAATIMSLFTNSYPPEIKRHPYGFGTFWDTTAVENGVELMIAAQGSGTGIEFLDVAASDGSQESVPDITFNWRFHYGADGSESDGEAGCLGGKNGKIFLRFGEISTLDWGFEDPSQCEG